LKEESIMFLAQNIKNFLKETFQKPKNFNNQKDQYIGEFHNGNCGSLLDDNDPTVDPACHSLQSNIYHWIIDGN
jgi:hypothetical protein